MDRKEIRKRIKMLEKNAENYAKNKITRQQYHVRRDDVNNRLAELKQELRLA